MTRKTGLIIGGTILTGVASYLVYNRWMKEQMLKEIYEILNGSAGDKEKDRITRIVNRKLSASVIDAFNPNFFLQFQKYGIKNQIGNTKAKVLVKDIYDAFGFFNDDEEQIYGAVRNARTKLDLSRVAYWYYKEHKKDLHAELQAKLGEDEYKKVAAIVEKLPSMPSR
ncbi:MAG: hypothetical protein COA79_20330 [Planctomycetota bacterium]|nr:MAG: hypothetical protein COA79_20330 [Planctomycetota bacterium]